MDGTSPTSLPAAAISPPRGERKREAWDKLRGYHYQIWYAVSQWLGLTPDEDLFIESAEDVDRGSDEQIVAGQLKNTAAPLSLNMAQAMKALTDYWTLKHLNADRKLLFNYITTGHIVEESNSLFTNSRKGIEVWESAKKNDADVEELRAFLIRKTTNLTAGVESPLPEGILTLLNDGTTEQLRNELIGPVTWFPNAVSFDKLQEIVANQIFAYSDRINDPLDSDGIATLKNNLFAEASRVATSNPERRLTARSLTDLFKNLTVLRIPRAMLRERLNPDDRVPQTRPNAVTINWANPSSDLEQWPTTVGDGQELERPELELIRKGIKETFKSAHLILGEAGSGKSALLAKLGKILTIEGVPHLGIKADFLSNDIQSLAQLVPDLGGGSLIAAVRAAAAERPFVVLVDQLDAVCSLTDRHTKRLTLILQFLRGVSEINGVHIVASCRPFEFASDIRLRTLNATNVQLSLPPWELVAAVLRAEGLNPEEFTGGSKEVLRVPWNLKLFLELSPPRPVMTSFYDLVGRVWSEAIRDSTSPVRCLELVDLLARRIDQSEEFWLPQALSDAYVPERENLVSEGILMQLTDHELLGFRHQTFYDYFLIRIFFRERISVNDYVAEHEQSFFIRPTVARALAYLRATNLPVYHKTLRELFQKGRLRLHLYFLVLEFVGKQQAPTPDEISILMPLLKDEKEGQRFLQAIIGSQGWFAALVASPFETEWMKATPARAQAASSVLAASIATAENQVVALIAKNWINNPVYDQSALWVLGQAVNWNPATLTLLDKYAERSKAGDLNWVLHQLVRIAPAKSTPLLGVQFRSMAKTAFEEVRAFRESQAAESVNSGSTNAPAGTTPDAQDALQQALMLRGMLQDDLPVAKMKELLAQDLFHHAGLEQVAQANPAGILKELWATVREGLEVNQQVDDDENLYYERDWIGVNHGIYSNREESTLWTMEIALKKLAETDSTAFLEWVDANKATKLLTVHRLIAVGMAQLPPDYADTVVRYLVEDARRFYLGDFQDDSEDTRPLLDKFSSTCSSELLQLLLRQIVDFPRDLLDRARRTYPNSNDERRVGSLRRDRARLLACIPNARMSDQARAAFDSDKAEFGEPRSGRSTPRSSFVGPPVRAEELPIMTDEAIFALVQEIPDGVEHNSRPEGAADISRMGGSIEQSRALAEFAVSHPARGKAILQKLQPGRHESYAAEILSRWADPKPDQAGAQPHPPPAISPIEIEQLAIELDRRGFISPEFRIRTAQTLQTVAKNKHGLTPETLEMLRTWILKTQTPTPDQDVPPLHEESDYSIIFSNHGSWICPSGRAPMAEAIVLGGLLRHPPAIEETVEFLEKFAESEKHPAVWAETLIHVPWLFGPLSSRMTLLVDSLFAALPTLLFYPQTAVFLGQVSGNVTPTETEQKWLLNLLARDNSYFRQLAGELVFLHYGRRQSSWASDLIDAGIKGTHGIDFLRGLTYAAGACIEAPHLGHEVEKILTAALQSPDTKVQDAAATFLMHVSDKTWSSWSKNLVLKLLQQPNLSRRNSDMLARQMELVALVDPDTALKVAEEMVRRMLEKTPTDSNSWPMAASHLTNIALAAQRDLTTRERGLVLFENLLELNLHDAKKAAELMNHRAPV